MIASTIMHVVSVPCFIAAAGAAGWAIYSTIAPARRNILRALDGLPLHPAASVAPHATAHSTPLRRVEAAAEPTSQVEV